MTNYCDAELHAHDCECQIEDEPTAPACQGCATPTWEWFLSTDGYCPRCV